MDKRAICMVIWFLLVILGAALTKIIPADWLYSFGFLMGSVTLPFCHIALSNEKR